jgi:uncharacterized membrane protein YbhN (UPF0104 family)
MRRVPHRFVAKFTQRACTAASSGPHPPGYSCAVTGLREFFGRKSVLYGLQIAFTVVILVVFAWVLRHAWREALPLLRDADLRDVGIALLVMAAYYLLFVLGWQWILRGLGIRIGYVLALQSEMASMLAKYVPGGVWTPLARVLWLRRAGVHRNEVVIGSIGLEAGLSAISGVLVFAFGLLTVDASAVVLIPLSLFALLVAVLIHPKIYVRLARRIFERFGTPEVPVLRYRTMIALLVFYAGTWLVGGVALLFLARSLGDDLGWSTVPYLGGTAAVGAIVSVLTVIAPSGLGVREGSTLALLLAVTTEAVAVGVTILNRLAITLVEAVLLGVGFVIWRVAKPPADPSWAQPVLTQPEPE